MNETLVKTGSQEVVVSDSSQHPIACRVLEILVTELLGELATTAGKAVVQAVKWVAVGIWNGWVEIAFEFRGRRLALQLQAAAQVLDQYQAALAHARSRSYDPDLVLDYERALRRSFREELARALP